MANYQVEEMDKAQAHKETRDKAIATLRDFVHVMSQGTATNPRQIPDALSAIDALSGQPSQENQSQVLLRAAFGHDVTDKVQNVLDAYGVNYDMQPDLARCIGLDAERAIVDRNLTLRP